MTRRNTAAPEVNFTAVSDGEAWIRVTNRSAQRRVEVAGITAYDAGGSGTSLNCGNQDR